MHDDNNIPPHQVVASFRIPSQLETMDFLMALTFGAGFRADPESGIDAETAQAMGLHQLLDAVKYFIDETAEVAQEEAESTNAEYDYGDHFTHSLGVVVGQAIQGLVGEVLHQSDHRMEEAADTTAHKFEIDALKQENEKLLKRIKELEGE